MHRRMTRRDYKKIDEYICCPSWRQCIYMHARIYTLMDYSRVHTIGDLGSTSICMHVSYGCSFLILRNARTYAFN